MGTNLDVPDQGQNPAPVNWRYLLSTAIILTTTFLFFRSVLPRIPRLFFRGRLRIKRAGLRGIRGIEWRSCGINRDSSYSAQDHDGLIIKVRHIYLTLRQRQRDVQEDEHGSRSCRSQRGAWITLHIDGVGITLPHSNSDTVEGKEKQRIQARSAKLEEDTRRMQAQEERIERLMQERPLSPDFRHSRSASPSIHAPSGFPAISSALGHTPEPRPAFRMSNAKIVSFRIAWSLLCFMRSTVVPLIVYAGLRIVRSGAYFAASALPFLTSILDMEVHHVECYAVKADAVLRAAKITVGAHTEVVDSSGPSKTSQNFSVPATSRAQQSLGEKVSAALAAMPNRIGSGAKDAASFVFDGLPGMRANLQLTTEGVQAFDANKARHLSNSSSQNETYSHGRKVSSEAQEWRGAPGHVPGFSARPSLQRAQSEDVSSFHNSEGRTSRWAGRWADWTLESRPNADFAPHTNWAHGATMQPISDTARLFALQESSYVKLGASLGRTVSSESLHISTRLAPLVISADAFLSLQNRVSPAHQDEATALSDEKSTQSKAPPRHLVRLLEMLGSVSVEAPSIATELSSKLSVDSLTVEQGSSLPTSIQLATEIQGLTFNITNSDYRDEMHHQWFGACGVKGYRGGKQSTGFSKSFRWPGRKKASFIEHRRIFAVGASIASVDAFLGIDGQKKSQQSHVFHLDQWQLSGRSSWTPVGLLSANFEQDAEHVGFFRSDPNEPAIIFDTQINRIHGDVKLQHCASMIAVYEHWKSRADQEKEHHAAPSSQRKTNASIGIVPRFALHCTLLDIEYTVNASELMSSEQKRLASTQHRLTLKATIPRIQFNLQGSYIDQYIRRSENEKRAAWKSLARDELEWSLEPRTCGIDEERNSPAGKTLPRDTLGNYSNWQSSTKGEQREGEKITENAASQNLTMLEALEEMKRLQTSSKPRIVRRRSSSKGAKGVLPSEFPSMLLSIDSWCLFDSMDLHWDMHGFHDHDLFSTYEDVSEPSKRLFEVNNRKESILSMHAFEWTSRMGVPGVEDLAKGDRKLLLSETTLDARANLEGFDIDFWKVPAVEAMRRFLEFFANAKYSTYDTQNKMSNEPGEPNKVPTEAASISNDEQSRTDKEQQNHSSRALIDKLKPGWNLYFSIGAITAHVGGIDERCDPGTSRGVGLNIKRTVFQVASAKLEARKNPDAPKVALGARSALDLPEDLRSSVAAIAVKHGKAASAKLSLHGLGIFPLLDADIAKEQHKSSLHHDNLENMQTVSSPSLIAPAVWDFQNTRPERTSTQQRHSKFRQQDPSNFIVWMPQFSIRVNLIPKRSRSDTSGGQNEELTVSVEDVRLLSFKIELLHTYCLLVAASTLRRLIRDTMKKASAGLEKDQTGNRVHRQPLFAAMTYRMTANLNEIHVSVSLPDEIKLFLLLQRMQVGYATKQEPYISFEWLIGAVESPQEHSSGVWEEIARLRDFRVSLQGKGSSDASKGSSSETEKPVISVSSDSLTLRVPYGYTVHPIIDNTIVAIKVTKQLLHHFIKGKDDSVILPVAEGPKKVPNIHLRFRILALEAQDDPFETRLNIIWRSGGDENQARAEREAAFEEKLQSSEALRKKESVPDSIDSYSSFSSLSSEEESRKQASITAEQARRRLDAFNASSWIRRFTNAKAEQSRREDATRRRIHGRLPVNFENSPGLPIKLAPRSKAAPLMRSIMTDFTLDVSPPSFPESHLRDFLYEQGDRIPRDMEYSLLVPLSLQIRMSEWRMDLRDYPMPLLHFPPIDHSKQPKDLAGIEMKVDCVIAEQLGTPEALRHIPAIVVPAATGRPDAIEYGISVPRMSMPTKFFGSPTIHVNSSYTSRIVWGQSIQPAIQDVVRVLEGITSPPQDPSPRIGFWDKLSLIMQTQLRIRFSGDGQCHFYLKGSRDPYHILGHGAGWVKCWRGNVEILVNYDNKDREVFQILSDEYLLAIPDLKDYIDRAATGTEDRAASMDENDGKAQYDRASDRKSNPALSSSVTNQRFMKEPDFKKVCLKLTNGVRWGSGLLLERTCTDESCQRKKKCRGAPFYRECRFWQRKHHWQVYTRSKEYVQTLPMEKRGDSFDNWRSHHLHFSISVTSPVARPSKRSRHLSTETGEPNAANNFYFTPLAWEHFWAWMRLFDSALGLPIRYGKLFPGSLEQSPKFGRHLGTIKYRFDIAPLFIAHVYAQEDKQDWAHGRTTKLGIKSRMSTFHLDFHQRQQEMVIDRPELGGPRKKFHKPYYEAEVDLADINFRTLAGQFEEPDKRLFPPKDYDDEDEDNNHDNIFREEDNYAISDDDLEWYDLNDFVEVDWAPTEGGKAPRIKLVEAITCPRFNYYRRIESKRERGARMKGNVRGEDVINLERTKFGHEATHTCLVGITPTPVDIQKDLTNNRLSHLQQQLADLIGKHKDTVEGEKEVKVKIKLLQDYLSMLNEADKVSEKDKAGLQLPESDVHEIPRQSKKAMEEWQSFDNRYFIHNPIVFYSNTTRDVLLKYYLSSRRRRGVVHSLSARAVRNIRNLGTSKQDGRQGQDSSQKGSANDFSRNEQRNNHSVAPEELRGLLRESMSFLMPDDEDKEHGSNHYFDAKQLETFDPSSGISDLYEVRRSNACVLLKPQIVLRSLVDENSTIIITAVRTRMQNYSVMDPTCEEDNVNERVLYRNFVGVDALQVFHPSRTCAYLNKSRQRFGLVHVPLETLIDLRHCTTDFDRLAPRTDASIFYDKFNKLRLNDPSRPVASKPPAKANLHDQEAGPNDHLCHMMDLISVQCPRYSVSASSEQFAAIYNVVTDLILYRDPAYREHAKKLEMMMLSYDLTNIDALADMVQGLQVRIRHAKELHAQYHLHFAFLNEGGRLAFLTLKAEINDMQDELNLLLEAVTATDDSSDKEKKLALRVDAQAQDIGWNMMGDRDELLAKLTIKGVSFTWLNKADNSVANTLSVADLNALNVHPDAVFAEIITKYNRVENHPMKEKGMLLNAMWSVLAPVGGIAIVDHFELNLHPMRIQMEHRIGRQIEEYIFGSMREKKREREQRDHLRQIDQEGGHDGNNDGKAPSKGVSPFKRLAQVIRGGHRTAPQSDEQAEGGRPKSNVSTSGAYPSRLSIDRKGMGKRSTSARTIESSEGWTPRSTTPAASNRNSMSAPGPTSGGGSLSAPNSDADANTSENESEENSQQVIAARNAMEMRERASHTVTFVYFKLSETIFCLSYKSEKQRSITDLYDLVFRTPRLEYRNRTWAHADLANHLKRDIFRAAWSQKSTLLKGVINHRRPPAKRVAAAAMTLTRTRHSTMENHDMATERPHSQTSTTADNDVHAENKDDSINGQPKFSLQVDPPSFSNSQEDTDVQGDQQSGSVSDVDDHDSMGSAEHSEGEKQTGSYHNYQAGEEITQSTSATNSHESGSHTMHSERDSGLSRLLARTLHKRRGSSQPSVVEQSSSQERDRDTRSSSHNSREASPNHSDENVTSQTRGRRHSSAHQLDFVLDNVRRAKGRINSIV